jgi:hypothetical protein
MKDPIKNRFDEFIDRVENEEGDQATNEVIAYLKGFADNEENKTERTFLNGYIRSLEIIISSNKNINHLRKENDDLKFQLRKALRKIVKLEKIIAK